MKYNGITNTNAYKTLFEALTPYLLFFLGIFVFLFFLELIRKFLIFSKNKKIRSSIYDNEYILASKFLNNWKGDRKNKMYQSGYKTQDQSGCYVIFSFPFPMTNENKNKYSDVYVGQSIHICQRVYQHLTGHGNGDVYHAYKSKQYVYVAFYPCPRRKMNDVEKSLIQAFHATKSFNRQKGGSRKR